MTLASLTIYVGQSIALQAAFWYYRYYSNLATITLDWRKLL